MHAAQVRRGPADPTTGSSKSEAALELQLKTEAELDRLRLEVRQHAHGPDIFNQAEKYRE